MIFTDWSVPCDTVFDWPMLSKSGLRWVYGWQKIENSLLLWLPAYIKISSTWWSGSQSFLMNVEYIHRESLHLPCCDSSKFWMQMKSAAYSLNLIRNRQYVTTPSTENLAMASKSAGDTIKKVKKKLSSAGRNTKFHSRFTAACVKCGAMQQIVARERSVGKVVTTVILLACSRCFDNTITRLLENRWFYETTATWSDGAANAHRVALIG